MKMAALTASSAAPVNVAPAPPQRALSMICPPCHNQQSPFHQSIYPQTHQLETHLRVPNKHNLRTRTPLIIRRDSPDHCRSALLCRIIVADASALRLATTCWVLDGFRAGARVCGDDLVDKAAGGAVACWCSCLAGAEDVDFGAVLPFGEVDRVGGGEAGNGEGGCGGESHCGFGRWDVWRAGRGDGLAES